MSKETMHQGSLLTLNLDEIAFDSVTLLRFGTITPLIRNTDLLQNCHSISIANRFQESA